MTELDVLWSVEAERDLLGLPPSEAEGVIASVEEFARTGRGFLRVLLDGSGERRLYVDRHYVIIEVVERALRCYRVRAR